MGTRQMLSMMVANYLMIGVWGQGGPLAGLARLPTFSLHWGLADGYLVQEGSNCDWL